MFNRGKKQWMSWILAGMLTLSLTACGNENKNDAQAPEVTTEISDNAEAEQETEEAEQETEQETEAPEQETEEPEQETEAPEQETEAPEQETETAVEEQEEAVEGDASTYYVEQYKEVLDTHYKAYKKQWSPSKMQKNNLSLIAACAMTKDPLEDYGYAFLDVDGDGSYELLFGTVEETEDYQKAIFEMYTLKNEKPVQVFCSEERDRYFIGKDGKGGYIITNCGASSSSEIEWEYSVLKEGTLSTFLKIMYSEETNKDNPWFMEEDGIEKSISQEKALKKTENYENQQIMPEFTKLILLK